MAERRRLIKSNEAKNNLHADHRPRRYPPAELCLPRQE